MKNNELLKDLDRVIKEFIYTAEFVEFDAVDMPKKPRYDTESMEKVKSTCKEFLMLCDSELTPEELTILSDNIDTDISSVGGDLYYNINGHGVGFWDRENVYGNDLADKLATLSNKIKPLQAFIYGQKIYFE